MRTSHPSVEDEILDSAAALLAHRGPKVSIQEIADAVGLSKAGLQHHFPSKDRLVTGAIEHASLLGSRVLAEVAHLPVGAARDLRAVQVWVDVALQSPGSVALLLSQVTAPAANSVDPDNGSMADAGIDALRAFGVDPDARGAERTVRVAGALAALAVLAMAAHQQDLAITWRPFMVATCFDALGHRGPGASPSIPISSEA